MNSQNAMETSERSDMDDTLSIHEAAVNKSHLSSVVIRLSRRWGMRPESTRWALYAMDRGLRGRVIDALDEFAAGDGVMTWFAPILEKFLHAMDGSTITPHDKAMADLKQNVAAEAYRHEPTPEHRRKFYLAMESAGIAGLAYAAVLRAEEEAER